MQNLEFLQYGIDLGGRWIGVLVYNYFLQNDSIPYICKIRTITITVYVIKLPMFYII